jgi:CheY-like chemotaxis protein
MLDDGRLTFRTRNVYLEKAFGRLNRVAVGEYVRLDVADTGPGIPPEVLSRMFEPFFSSKRADDQRGSGLGLSIVEAVVADHHGYVDVETRLGLGATFSLYFPAARGAVLPVESGLVGGNGESVLVVDDDSTQREVIGRLLRQLSYRVRVAGRADEALALLRAEPVDLLILDMVMPRVDGAELYRRALALRPGTPAIVVSGFAESRRVRLARELGAVDFLQKPLTLGKLARAVRAALDTRGGPRDNQA